MSTFNNIGTKMLNFASNVFSGLKGSEIELAIKDATKNAQIASKTIEKGSLAYKAGDFMGKGTRKSIENYSAAKLKYGDKASLTKAIKDAHMVNGKIDGKAVAGTAIGASVVGRVATGGGLYRDKDGNVNIPGVPFI